MACAPPAARGFSPLDEELDLLPGRLSSWLVEATVRLGTWLPFEQVAEALDFFTKVRISEETARRLTEQAGAAQVALEAAAVEILEREASPSPPGPPVQQVSVDGAMVPLVGGDWAEVKTAAVGAVTCSTVGEDGHQEVHAKELSYFSRLADSATFTRAATVELHRRGTFRAGTVVAPMDGAEWQQGFLDYHRPDAVRILDFPHAVEHLNGAAQVVWGPGTGESTTWLKEQAHTLKHGDPGQVLEALRTLPVEGANDPDAAGRIRDGTLQYLGKRREQIEYARFLALGYPIGSGSVESANKLVVENRLKGSGMHWARANVNPMVALRGVACSDRWAEGWPALWRQLHSQHAERRRHRCCGAQHIPNEPATALSPAPALSRAKSEPRPAPQRSPKVVNGRPTADHPWRKPFLPQRRPTAPAKI